MSSFASCRCIGIYFRYGNVAMHFLHCSFCYVAFFLVLSVKAGIVEMLISSHFY